MHDSGEAAGFVYYVMPFSDGESLAHRLEREGEVPVDDAVEYLLDVLEALSYAHEQGVVHRDIKPGNVLVRGHRAMIADFGVAKALTEAATHRGGEVTAAGVVVGTPAYMAPEQAAADPSIDRRVDIYSVGVLAYELLTGAPPFRGGTPQSVLTRQITEAPIHICEQRPSVPATLGAVVMRCLEKKPSDRWQSADELLPVLRSIRGASDRSLTPHVPEPTHRGRLARRARNTPGRGCRDGGVGGLRRACRL